MTLLPTNFQLTFFLEGVIQTIFSSFQVPPSHKILKHRKHILLIYYYFWKNENPLILMQYTTVYILEEKRNILIFQRCGSVIKILRCSFRRLFFEKQWCHSLWPPAIPPLSRKKFSNVINSTNMKNNWGKIIWKQTNKKIKLKKQQMWKG